MLMRTLGVGIAGIFACVALVSSQQAAPQSAAPGPPATWYKGSIHTHTSKSIDGESAPEVVAQWYRERKYDFLVLSDHNVLTEVEPVNAWLAAHPPAASAPQTATPRPFLLIPGEELSDGYSTAAVKPAAGERDLDSRQVHLGALGIGRLVEPKGGQSVFDTLQRDVDAVRSAGGVPVINHPNFTWSLTAEDLTRVRNARLFEIFNGHLQANNAGGGGRPGVEEMWDRALSAGTVLYGVATDDSHWFQRTGEPPVMTAPGRGWVYVRARDLSAASILEAMERGDFYASTGVVLAGYEVTAHTMTITVQPKSRSKYRVLFIGKGGRILEDVPVDPVIAARVGPLNPTVRPVVYTFRGNEGYVRAKVLDSNGLVAWMQPVMLTPAR